MRKRLFILFIGSAFHANAQNLFPVKTDNCKAESFCLDCGDIKAGYDDQEFAKLEKKLNKELYLRGMGGGIKLQVLVDSNGQACVLSHTDESSNPVTLKIIEELNMFRKWTPAITNGKKEEKASINLSFVIEKRKLSGQIERVDLDTFLRSFD